MMAMGLGLNLGLGKQGRKVYYGMEWNGKTKKKRRMAMWWGGEMENWFGRSAYARVRGLGRGSGVSLD
jgi:hypothetical protein